MAKFPIFILTLLFVLTNKLHLSTLICIKLSLNYLNKISEASSKDLITPSILSAITYGVLSSAQLVISVFSIINNKSIKKNIE